MKVHPELIGRQVPRKKEKLGKKFWEHRYEDINAFERHLVRNGTVILKFFLNVSKDEQKARFLERLSRPEKHWKFSAVRPGRARLLGRLHGAPTRTPWRPRAPSGPRGTSIPADHKWVTRAVVADIVTTAIRGLDLKYPEVTEEHGEAAGRGPQEAGRGIISGRTVGPGEVRTWGRASKCLVRRPTRR